MSAEEPQSAPFVSSSVHNDIIILFPGVYLVCGLGPNYNSCSDAITNV